MRVAALASMREIIQQLISAEAQTKGGAGSPGRIAFRVCDKLRKSLATLMGVAGFQSLLSRAVSLAKKDVPWVAGLQINPDGSFRFTPELEAQFDTDEAIAGGSAVIAQVLGLLITFIGEALTLRLVQQTWPNTALKNMKREK